MTKPSTALAKACAAYVMVNIMDSFRDPYMFLPEPSKPGDRAPPKGCVGIDDIRSFASRKAIEFRELLAGWPPHFETIVEWDPVTHKIMVDAVELPEDR